MPKVRSGSWDMSPLTAISTNFPNAIGTLNEIIEEVNSEVMDFAYVSFATPTNVQVIFHSLCTGQEVVWHRSSSTSLNSTTIIVKMFFYVVYVLLGTRPLR